LAKAGFDVVLLETRHVKAALAAMTVKTDREAAARLDAFSKARARDAPAPVGAGAPIPRARPNG
jgi:hypothetical protein